MTLSFESFYKKLLGCYTGKAIGGTLGMPFEGKTDIREITFYDPMPAAMAGNDDIDLQIIAVESLVRNGLPVNRKHLADAWRHIQFGPDEYGVAIHNMRNGLSAPLCGSYNNKFYAGMGAAIRSELWAALAPGNPELAVSLAREDACVDHYSDGIDACVFLTAIESAAYIESDFDTLLDVGFSYLSKGSRLEQGLRDTLLWWKACRDCYSVRNKIIEKYGVFNWTDVTINICFILLAWLAGKGDFDESICFAVNFGYDTDCTAASLGAILGIINPDSISERWKAPIGNKIVLSDQIVGIHEAPTIESFCEKISLLAKNSIKYYGSSVQITDIPEFHGISTRLAGPWTNNPQTVMLKEKYSVRESLVALSPLIINLIYPEAIALKASEWSNFTARITNPSTLPLDINVQLRVPEGFQVDPPEFHFELAKYEEKSISFSLYSEREKKKASNLLDFNLTVNNLSYTVSAGIITAFPWIKKASDGIAVNPANSFIQPITAGERIYAIDVKSVMSQQVAFTCQGTRPLSLRLNGELILKYDGQCYVPAVHRGFSALGNLNRGWNSIVIQLEDGPDGEMFFAIGSSVNWIWKNDLEWRRPAGF